VFQGVHPDNLVEIAVISNGAMMKVVARDFVEIWETFEQAINTCDV
jgi:hypothetical protein